MNLSDVDRLRLIDDIARRAGTAKRLAKLYGISINELQTFVDDNKEQLEIVREAAELDALENKEFKDPKSTQPTPTQLSELWITNKFERLLRYQQVAEALYKNAKYGDQVATREFRTYLHAAAEELGQLLNRGAGEAADGDVLSVDIKGVNMESLK
jgi:hypothetical protein